MRFGTWVTTLLLASPALARGINVPGDYPTISQGIDAAVEGDTVWVHPGTYFETDLGFAGKAIVVTGLDPDDSLTVVGTVVSGGGSGRPFTFDQGEGEASVLAGLTITKGFSRGCGGGVYCENASPTIDRCRIVWNQTDKVYGSDGGGVCGVYCSARFVKTTIANNLVDDLYNYAGGGGVSCYGGSPIFVDCLIENNSVNSYYARGGGLTAKCADLTLDSVIVRGNFVTRGDCADGGGICLGGDSGCEPNTVVLDCIIEDNMAGQAAGGVLIEVSGGHTLIERSSISDNQADWYAGGLRIRSDEPVDLRNCIITGNRAAGHPWLKGSGGGVYSSRGKARLQNCTIAGNYASGHAGGIHSRAAPITLIDSIVWGNEPNEISGGQDDVDISWSTVRAEWPGEGNLHQDPLFRDPENGDWRLRSIECGFEEDSPAIDSGDPAIRDRWLDCDFGLGAIRADQGAYGGGACALEIVPDRHPVVAFRGDSLKGSIEIANGCDDTLAFDRVVVELNTAPPWTRTAHDGPVVAIEPGGIVQHHFAVAVPPWAPIGVYRAGIVLSRYGADVSEIKRSVVIRGEEAIEIRVPLDVGSITQAIALTLDGDAVVIAPGTYLESSVDLAGKAITVRSENPSDPRTVAETIVDGSGAGSVFVFQSEEDTNSVLAGLTITGGKARQGGGIRCLSSPRIEDCVIQGNWATSHDSAPVGDFHESFEAQGGGVYCEGEGSPIFRRCDIVENGVRVEARNTSGGGGGVYCSSAFARFELCRIDRNRAVAIATFGPNGGGVACDHGASALFVACSIDENQILGSGDWSGALGSGGGLYCSGDDVELIDCSISRNRIAAESWAFGGGVRTRGGLFTMRECRLAHNVVEAANDSKGGGVFADYGSFEATDCNLTGNSAVSAGNGSGGGLYSQRADILLVRTDFLHNTCSHNGGGVLFSYGSPRMSGCTLRANQADKGGGAYLQATAELDNCTLSHNRVTNSGSGIYVSNQHPTLASCILWNNDGDEIHDASVGLTVVYSIIEGGWPGEGNLDQDPLFHTAVDLRLRATRCGWNLDSPAIDSGAPWLEDRLLGCHAGLGTEFGDIGAYGGEGAERSAEGGWVYQAPRLR